MVLEDYNLSRLRDDVLDEFAQGKDDDDLRLKATKFINDAITFICRARKDWPWTVRELAIDVPNSYEVIAGVTNGARLLTNVQNAGGLVRKILVDGDLQGSALHGYLVASENANDIVLHSQWLGADNVLQTLPVVHGWFQLPDDFQKLKVLSASENVTDVEFCYRTPLVFDKIKRERNLVSISNYIYTVKPDPLALEARSYVAVYPFITQQMTLYGSYWRSPQKLVQDPDVPIVPRDDRLVVLNFAYWYMSHHLKADSDVKKSYEKRAYDALGLMAQAYELSEDTDDLVGRDNYEPGLVQFPPGYPDVRTVGPQ